MKLFDATCTALEKSMDLQLKRHSLLASNIANSETPNYRARDLDFAGELKRAIGDTSSPLVQTNERHLDVASETNPAHVVLDTSGRVGADGNNVDLDISMGKLSSSVRDYSNAITLMQQKFRNLRYIVTGARG